MNAKETYMPINTREWSMRTNINGKVNLKSKIRDTVKLEKISTKLHESFSKWEHHYT